MAFDIEATLDSIESKVASSGHVREVTVGEPKAPPSAEGITAAIYMASAEVSQVSLNSTIERHIITIRLYNLGLHEPTMDRDSALDAAMADLLEDILGDFDLGATIRNVDVGGELGVPLSNDWGYVEIGGPPSYRVIELTLPLIVDDSATLVA